jgi:hypothetical protein
MLPPQKDSKNADRRNKSSGLLVVNGIIICALVGLALINRGSSTLISETVQAEFVSPNLGSAAPIQLAQPVMHGWGARVE